MSSYFQNARTSETNELQEDLNSLKLDVRREAVKQVIASMTYGKDMSTLFPHVVKCIETTSIELKKLVYLYIINYAKSRADMTIMAIHSFRKDAHEQSSPLLRALAIRTMGCIRIEKITEYLCESLKDALADVDPYVRKTAAICVTKLFTTNPRLVKDNGFIKLLQDMLVDGNPLVVSNAVAALLEIANLTGKNYIRLNSGTMQKLLYAINECSEWGQIYILEGIAKYRPVDSKDAENIIERVIPRLSHANPAVVLAAAKVVLKLLDCVSTPEAVTKTTKRLSGPLVTLLANSAEIQYVVLRNINFIIERRKYIFDQPKVFFIRHNDPVYVKLEKLNILSKITTAKNFDAVLAELREYANWLEIEFVRKAIRTIATIGVSLEKATKRALELLLDVLKSGGNYVAEECTIGLSEILRHYPAVATESFVRDFVAKAQGVTEPDARAGYAWVLGEYNEQIPKVDELLKPFAEGILEEPGVVQHQLLLASVKYYLKNSEGNDGFIMGLLKQVGEESENPDIRDRAYIYWRLLNVDPNNAAAIVFHDAPVRVPLEDVISIYDDDYVEFLIDNMATTVSVQHKPLTEFIPENMMQKKIELSDDEGEKEREREEPPKDRKREHRRRKQVEQPEPEEEKASDKDKDKGPKPPGKGEDDSPQHEENTKKDPGPGTGTGGFDLLGFGDIPSEDLGVNSGDVEYLSEGGKGLLVEAFREGQTGSKGTKGVAVSAAFVRNKGTIVLKLVVINKGMTALNRVELSLARNSFGLAAMGKEGLDVPGQSKKRIEMVCGILESNLNSGEPPSCPFQIRVTLTAAGESFSFDVPCLLHILYNDNSQLSKDEFKNYWQRFDKSKETALDLPALKTSCQSPESLRQTLERFNIGITTIVNKPDSGQTMLYCSCQTVNRLPLVMEIALPSGKPGLAARIVARVPVLPLAPLVVESLKFILLEQLQF